MPGGARCRRPGDGGSDHGFVGDCPPGWHPYWNQLWGLALFPYALLFGWHALAARSGRAATLFVLFLVALELAYPLALPYPC